MTMHEISKLPYKNDRKSIPQIAGIYFLVKNNILLYVGQSKNIRKRLSGHKTLFEIYKPKIYYYEMNTDLLRTTLEKKFINELKPLMNITI